MRWSCSAVLTQYRLATERHAYTQTPAHSRSVFVGKRLLNNIFLRIHYLLVLLPARRYTSAGISCRRMCMYVCVCVCLSVCLSHTGIVSKRCSDWDDFFAQAYRFSLTYTTLYSREIMVSSKIRVLPLRTLSLSLDLEKFATAHRPSASAI